MNSIQYIKSFVRGTPLEPLARRFVRLLRPPAHVLRHERDTKLANDIMGRTLHADSNCLDIGAHRGEWLTYFRKFAPAGQHIAVEPLPHLAAMLRENFPDVEVHECALATGQGMAQFVHAVDIEGWSGLRRQDYAVDTREEHFDVAVRRLDDIMGERDIAFVKVDVEGAEFLALDGGKEFLSRCRPHVFFELAHVHASVYEATPEQMHELLASCHLRVETLDGRPLTAEDLRTVYDHAHQIGYGPSAQTNFLAVPAQGSA